MKSKSLSYIVIVAFILLVMQRGFNYITHVYGNKKDPSRSYLKKESSNQSKGIVKPETKPEKSDTMSDPPIDTTKQAEMNTTAEKPDPKGQPKTIDKAKKVVEKVKTYYQVVTSKCIGCGLCRKNCPNAAISQTGPPNSKGLKTAVIDKSKCKACSLCQSRCPASAIIRREGR